MSNKSIFDNQEDIRNGMGKNNFLLWKKMNLSNKMLRQRTFLQ
jgi:hypothetical protein